MATVNQNSSQSGSPPSLLDKEALKRFGRWWEARLAQGAEQKPASETNDRKAA